MKSIYGMHCKQGRRFEATGRAVRPFWAPRPLSGNTTRRAASPFASAGSAPQSPRALHEGPSALATLHGPFLLSALFSHHGPFAPTSIGESTSTTGGCLNAANNNTRMAGRGVLS